MPYKGIKAVCPKCGRAVAVRTDALLALHRDKPPGFAGAGTCEGSGTLAHLVRPGRPRGRRPAPECRYGHPYDKENTYIDPRGRRVCRACKRNYMRAVRGAAEEAR